MSALERLIERLAKDYPKSKDEQIRSRVLQEQCKAVFEKKCEKDHYVEELCRDPISELWNIYHMDNCRTVSKDICRDVQDKVCKDVLGEKYEDIPSELCNIFYVDNCRTVSRDVCRDVPEVIEGQVPHEVSKDIPRKESATGPGTEYKDATEDVCENKPQEVCYDETLVALLSSSNENQGACTTLGLAPSCYSPTSADAVDIFNKLEDDSTALSQDLEELQEDLGLLMEKHGVAGPSDGWDEKFYLPMGWSGDCGFIEPEVSLEIQDHKAGLMFSSPILSRPTEIMMLFSLYLDTLLDPIQPNPWPPDSMHQFPLTFTCATSEVFDEDCQTMTDRNCKTEVDKVCEAGSREECHTKSSTTRRIVQNRQRGIMDEQICSGVTTEECKEVHYKEQCHSITKDVCSEVPTQNCVDVPSEVCKDASRVEGRDVENTACQDVSREDCTIVSNIYCEDVPKEECSVVPGRECATVPGNDFIDIIEDVFEDKPQEFYRDETLVLLLTSPGMAMFTATGPCTANYEEDHGPSTTMFLPLILSSSMEIMMLFPPYLDTLLDPIQLNPWPPDSLHQFPLTFTCATLIAVQGFTVLYGSTSHCRIENASLDPAESRPYLGALVYIVTPLNASAIKSDEGSVLQSTWDHNGFTVGMARLCKPYLGSIRHPNPYTRIMGYSAHDQMAVCDLSADAVNMFVKPENLAPEDWKDDGSLPHGWKPIRKLPNVKTKPVDCSLCDRVSEWRMFLNLHIQEKHTDEENYTAVETSGEIVENSKYENTLGLAAESLIKEVATNEECDNAVAPVGEILENRFHNHDDHIPILKISTSIYQLMIRLVNPTQAKDALGVAEQPVKNVEDDKDSNESYKYFDAIDADIAVTSESKETVDDLGAIIQKDETTDGANKSREVFESGQSTIVGCLALEALKDAATLPHGWKTRQPVENPKDAQELNETCDYFEAGSWEECPTEECKDVHYKEQCHSITKDVCNEVPKQHWVDVSEEKCDDVPREHCPSVQARDVKKVAKHKNIVTKLLKLRKVFKSRDDPVGLDSAIEELENGIEKEFGQPGDGSIVQYIMDQLQSVNPEDRICGCHSLASLTSKQEVRETVLQTKVVRICGPLLLDADPMVVQAAGCLHCDADEEQKPHQVTKHVYEQQCEDITITSCKPVTKTSCTDHVEKVPRQEVCVVKPKEKCVDEQKPVTTTYKKCKTEYTTMEDTVLTRECKQVEEQVCQKEPQTLAINLIPKEELRHRFDTFVNHFSSFKSLSGLKRVMNYSDTLVKDKRSIYDELTVLDYERADWYKMCESDNHTEYSEDNDDVNVEVPDDRPAVPESRSRTPSTIITTSSTSSGQTTTVRQSSTITEAVARSVTSPIVICNVPPLTTKIQGSAHTEEGQTDVFTAVQYLEMYALDAMNIAKRDALNPEVEIDSEEECENLSKRLQILRS